MKLKRKTPSGLFPSPYKTKYTRYPIHFYISNIFIILIQKRRIAKNIRKGKESG